MNNTKALNINGRTYAWPKQPVVVVCIDGSQPEYIEEAVANYKKSAKLLDSKSVSPYYLKKAGILLEQNDEVEAAIEVYELALSTYLKDAQPALQNIKNEMKKLLARANASK